MVDVLLRTAGRADRKVWQPWPPEIYTIRARTVGSAPRSLGDQIWGGPGTLAGTVTLSGGAPVARRVRLYDRRTGLLLRETWSAADGSYRFNDLDPAREYYAVALDYTRAYNLTGADGLTPEVPG